MSRSTLTVIALVSVFLVLAALGSPAEAFSPKPIISQMQVPIIGETYYNPATDNSCGQPVNVVGTLNIVTIVRPPNPNDVNPTPMVTVLANVAGLTGTSSILGFKGFGSVEYSPTPITPSLDLQANFSLVAIGVVSPGTPLDTPPSPCIGMASDLQVRIRLTFDEDGNLTGATATPVAP
jgi:hypothetical protein